MNELPSVPRIRPVARRALATQSDERLVQLLREGHDAAFEEIVGRYQSPLTSFAAAFIPHHRAEDVVQASLLKAHKALLADDREIALRAWLFTIVRNGALNAIRDEPDWQELDPAYDGVPQPPAIAEQNEELQRLVVAICALPEAQRRALVGRELEGEGHAELATELGTTTTAVRGLIFRARTALRNSLGAMIPLPVLRMLLSSGAGAGAGAGGAGAGLGLGAFGLGGGVKLAATLSAAALVVSGGIALEKRSGRDGGSNVARAAETETQTARSSRPDEVGSSGDDAVAAARASATGSGDRHGGGPERSESHAGDDSGSDSEASGASAGGHQSSGHSGGGHSGPGSGPSPAPAPGDDDHSGPSGSGHAPGGGSDDDHSGPGGGEAPEPGDDDHSDSSPVPVPPPTEPKENESGDDEHEHSGPEDDDLVRVPEL